MPQDSDECGQLSTEKTFTIDVICTFLSELLQSPESIAKLFHAEYERLAPRYNYSTRVDTAKPWESVPENNRNLMVATCRSVFEAILASVAAQKDRN